MNNKSLLSLVITIFPFYLLLASCGGGGSSALPPSDTIGPNATPLNNGDVTTGKTPLVVNFNEAIFNAAKSDPDGMNMVLIEKISTNTIPGAVQINTEKNQLTFFPSENLVVNVEYELTLSNIFDGANNRLQANNGANYVWSFRVSDYPIIQINSGTNNIYQQPRYATNAVNNKVLAAWVEKSSTAYFLYTSIYSNRSWSQPELLDTVQSTARFISFLKDVTSNGLGFAVAWANSNNIFASVYSNGSWLTSPQLNINNADSAVLSSTYQPTTSPTANITGEGYAIAWTEATSAYASIFTNSQWGVATAVGTAPVTNSLRISSNGRGYAVVWTGNDPSTICLRGSQVFADIYSSAKGYWINTKNGFPTIISAGVDTLTLDTTQDAQQANVTSNGDSYLFHWYGSDQTQNGSFVHAAVFTQLDTETEQPQLDGPFKISNIGNPTNLQAVSNGSGYALTWEANGIAVANLNIDDSYMFINQYTYPSPNNRIGQWQQPLLLNNPAATAIAGSTTIAASNSGYAFVWQQTETDGAISFYSRVLNNTTWSDIELLSQRNLGDVRGKASITSKDNIFSVLWLQAKNNTVGNNDIYLNRFDGVNWETTPTRVSSANIPGNQEKFALVNESGTLLALWTQNDPSQFSGSITQQLLSKQVLPVSVTSNPMTPAQNAPQSLPGSIVGRDSNYVYATNQTSLAVFNIDSLGKTLTPVDAQPLSPATIENYTITATSAPATDNLGQTVFVATSSNRLNAYPVDRKTGKLLSPNSVSISASTNKVAVVIASHPNKYVYVLSRSTAANINGTISVYSYFPNGSKTLTPISIVNGVQTNTFTVQNWPTDLVIHPSGKYLYVINQNSKSISSFDITKTGELVKIADYQLAYFTSPGQQTAYSLINFAAISSNGDYLYVADEAGLGAIIKFTINKNNGTLNPATNQYTQGVGALPRNIIISPSGKMFYVIGSDSTIRALKIEPITGSLTAITKYGDIDNPGGSNTLTSIRGLAISPDGKQVYVADSLTQSNKLFIFDVNQLKDINNSLVPGGLYSPGKAAIGNTVQSGQDVTASKTGRCEVNLP